MTVHTEPTPNPNAMKFNSDKQIFLGEDSYSVMSGETSDYAILNELVSLDHVNNVLGYQYFITINKNDAIEWEELIPKVETVMAKHGY